MHREQSRCSLIGMTFVRLYISDLLRNICTYAVHFVERKAAPTIFWETDKAIDPSSCEGTWWNYFVSVGMIKKEIFNFLFASKLKSRNRQLCEKIMLNWG